MNQKLFLFINSWAGKNHFLDLLMIGAAKLMPYLFITILLFLWFKNKKNEALFAGYVASLGIAINYIIGFFYFHNRPFMNHLGVILIHHKADSSFPSDHTTFTMSIALSLLIFSSPRILGAVLTFLSLWCGIARVYAGVHYPFDILGSIGVSILAVLIIGILKKHLQKLNTAIIGIWEKL